MSRSWLIVPLLILYLLDLGGVGFLGPDEPRYASIGREMAHSFDFVTPRLDGQPWFEKPPLLYWMIVVGRFARLPDEWAARLPVALASIGFLIFFFRILLREFSPRTAIAASTILAASAGWLGFSFAAVTDLPMSAAFAAAMFLTFFDKRPKSGYVAGVLLGVSILAKAFVPLVLFFPIFLMARGKRISIAAGCVAVALPWHLLCWADNGSAFWMDYFWKHQVLRFFTADLQHVQPFWYFFPVLLAGLFPWTPLVALLVVRKTYEDERVRYLAAWLLYALVFFSASRNKLPGYVLPLMPAMAVLLAQGLEKSGVKRTWAACLMAASAALLVALPVLVKGLPQALLAGIGKTDWEFSLALPFVLVAAGVWWLQWSEKPSLAILALGMAVLFGTAYCKGKAFPELDQLYSVRGFWRAHQAQIASACFDGVRRDWEYGLNYYAARAIPECASPEPQSRIVVRDGKLAIQPDIP